jgi:hypothetical protein
LWFTLAPQQNMQATISEPTSLGRKCPQPGADGRVVAAAQDIAEHLRRHADQRAGVAL